MVDPSIQHRLSSRVRWGVLGALVCAAGLIALAPGCSRSSRSGRVSRVRISEVMAANTAFAVSDEAGRIVHVDWVELHNTGTTAVSLQGYTLSDDPGNRDKFEFPRGTTLGPDGYLLVFLLNDENCRNDCEEDVRNCRVDSAGDADDLAACEAAFAECRADCSPPSGLVADFNVSAAGETLYLYADRGNMLLDRVGVRAQANNVSNGLDPSTGEYGVMYVPTPRAPNAPINLKLPSIEVTTPRAPCDSEVLLRFKVTRDLEAPGDLEVLLEHAVIADCTKSLDGKPLETSPVTPVPAGGDPVRVDDSRTDPSGKPVSMEVVDLLYHAILPASPCEVIRKFRFTVRDALGVEQVERCVTYGGLLPTVVVNEYQPGNDQFVFEYVNRDNELVRPDPPPDWIEIYNYGDEPVDMSGLALVTGGELDDQVCDKWIFGVQGGVTEPLAPGGFLLVLADKDGGELRRKYFRSDDPSHLHPYYSTDFRLQADKKAPDYDEFALVKSSTCEPIDQVVLDFSANGSDLARGKSVARFGEYGTEPGPLVPGPDTITDCPTPEAKNLKTCDVVPLFEEKVTITTPSRSQNPAAGEPVTIAARVNFDADTRFENLEVVASVSVAAPAATLSLSPQQGGSAPGSKIYDILLEVPGQPVGTLVTFAFSARDLTLHGEAGMPVVHGPTAPRGEQTAFQYLVGYERPSGAPRLNEVIPANNAIILPPFVGLGEEEVRYHDFAEIYNPSSEPLDLGGYYLTTEFLPTDPIGLRRRWRFPSASGTVVPAGGFLPLYFGPPPASLPVDPPPEEQNPPYIEVKGFNLAACEETLQLVAPDDPLLGANSVVDSLHWKLNLDAGLCKTNKAFGRLCDDCDLEKCFAELAAPTPGASNRGFLPVLFHDSFHQGLNPARAQNACVGVGDVNVTTVFFVDTRLRDVFVDPASRFLSVSFIIDRGTGGPEEEEVVTQPPGGFRVCPAPTINCATPPEGYVNASTSILVSPPFGAVVRYRLRLVDACGTIFESEPAAFGTAAAPHPSFAINEVNRSHAVPGGETAAPRPWIEIYNSSGSDVDVSGMYLSDDPANPREAPFPDGTVVPRAGALVVLTDGAPLAPHASIDLDWTAEKGTLFLLDSDARGLCLLDSFIFNFAGGPGGASLGRLPDGTGSPVLLPEPSPGSVNNSETFVRGDATGDAKVDINDMIRMLGILVGGETRRPLCADALDADDEGGFNTTDPVFLANYLFGRGPDIPPPFPLRGLDPTVDSAPSCSE